MVEIEKEEKGLWRGKKETCATYGHFIEKKKNLSYSCDLSPFGKNSRPKGLEHPSLSEKKRSHV